MAPPTYWLFPWIDHKYSIFLQKTFAMKVKGACYGEATILQEPWLQ